MPPPGQRKKVFSSYSRKSFHEHLFSQPALRDYFDRFIRCTSINRFIRTAPICLQFHPGICRAAGKVPGEFFKTGDVVFRQDAAADKFFSSKAERLRWPSGKMGGRFRLIFYAKVISLERKPFWKIPQEPPISFALPIVISFR